MKWNKKKLDRCQGTNRKERKPKRKGTTFMLTENRTENFLNEHQANTKDYQKSWEYEEPRLPETLEYKQSRLPESLGAWAIQITRNPGSMSNPFYQKTWRAWASVPITNLVLHKRGHCQNTGTVSKIKKKNHLMFLQSTFGAILHPKLALNYYLLYGFHSLT